MNGKASLLFIALAFLAACSNYQSENQQQASLTTFEELELDLIALKELSDQVTFVVESGPDSYVAEWEPNDQAQLEYFLSFDRENQRSTCNKSPSGSFIRDGGTIDYTNFHENPPGVRSIPSSCKSATELSTSVCTADSTLSVEWRSGPKTGRTKTYVNEAAFAVELTVDCERARGQGSTCTIDQGLAFCSEPQTSGSPTEAIASFAGRFPYPRKLYSHPVADDQGKVYIIEGYGHPFGNPTADKQFLNEIVAIDLNASPGNQTTLIGSTGDRQDYRHRRSAVYYKRGHIEGIYLFGGSLGAGGRGLNEIAFIDLPSGNFNLLDAQLPAPGSDGAAVTDGRYIYIVLNAHIFRFDPLNESSEILHTFEETRLAPALAYFDGELIIAGDVYANKARQILAFNLQSRTLRTLRCELPNRAAYQVAAVKEGRVYFYGGIGFNADEVYSLDPRQETIINHGSLMPANYVSMSGAMLPDGRAFLSFGEESDSSSRPFVSEYHVFNGAEPERYFRLHEGLRSHSVIRHPSNPTVALSVGGFTTSNSPTGVIETIDISSSPPGLTKTAARQLATPRGSMAIAADHDSVYLLGGHSNGYPRGASAEVIKLNPNTFQSQLLGELALPLQDSCAFFDGERLVAMHESGDILTFDPGTRDAEIYPGAHTQRVLMACGFDGRRGYFFGGYDSGHSDYLPEIYEWNPNTQRLTHIDNMDQGRAWINAVYSETDQAFLIMGGHGVPTSELAGHLSLYQPATNTFRVIGEASSDMRRIFPAGVLLGDRANQELLFVGGDTFPQGLLSNMLAWNLR